MTYHESSVKGCFRQNLFFLGGKSQEYSIVAGCDIRRDVIALRNHQNHDPPSGGIILSIELPSVTLSRRPFSPSSGLPDI